MRSLKLFILKLYFGKLVVVFVKVIRNVKFNFNMFGVFI